MKEIEGYIFLPKFSSCNARHMFGPANKDLERPYDNLVSNNITPFTELDETKKVAQVYRASFKSLEKIDFAQIQIKAAESVEELSYFKDKSELILIANPTKDTLSQHDFFGPITNKKDYAGVLPFQELILNGFTTWNTANSPKKSWTSYNRAENALAELNRQGQRPGTISQFSIDFIVDN